jgi:NAD(P)H-hydrate epimerase
MTIAATSTSDVGAVLERATVIAVGPGLGRDAWAVALFERAVAAGKPLVIDADALNLLAATPRPMTGAILTPHPGEAARLLGTTTAVVQAERLASVATLAARFGAVAVLKGRGTLVAAAGRVPALISTGNPGMASGGMGDVLTGVVAGLLAQCPGDAFAAAAAAAFAHAAAGDLAAGVLPRGLLATDVIGALRACLNPPR